MDYKAETDNLLKQHGAVLKRQSRHEVWQLPNGSTFVRAKTPSSKDESKVDLATLKRLLGLQSVHVAGERREKVVKAKTNGHQRERFDRSVNTGLADKLLLAGVADSARQTEIESLRDALFAEQSHSETVSEELGEALGEIDYLTTQLAKPCVCFGCRVMVKVRRIMRKVLLYT